MYEKTLRQYIRQVGISPQPWRQYRGEIRSLCISAQCLFRNNGIPWDVLEMDLKSAGYIYEWENFWDVLSDPNSLYRKVTEMEYDDVDVSDFTEEDFKANGWA